MSRRFTRILPNAFHSRPAPKPEDTVDKQNLALERQKENLGRFILALSDQQLITGLAILFAGFCKTSSMSTYHFNIVASLAWFSSVTHLATLGVLRTYLIRTPAVRKWRVVLMVVVLILLLVALPPRWEARNDSRPVCCYYSNKISGGDGFSLLLLWFSLGFVVVTYIQRITRLYSLDADWNIPDFVIETSAKWASIIAFQSEFPDLPYTRTKKTKTLKNSGASHLKFSTAKRLSREHLRSRNLKTRSKALNHALKPTTKL